MFIQDKVVLVGSTKSDENIFDGVQNSGSGKKRGVDVGDTEKTLPKLFSPRRKKQLKRAASSSLMYKYNEDQAAAAL